MTSSTDTIKTTGAPRVFDTGAQRDANNDKGRMDLLPWLALIRLSKHFQRGGARYGYNNWRKGIPREVLLDSAMRHLAKALMGWTDEDHLAAAAWNVTCAMEFEELAGSPQPAPQVTPQANPEAENIA